MGVPLNAGNQVLEVQSFDPDADYLFAGDYGWGDVVVSARVSIQDTSGDYYGLFVKAQPGTDFYTTYFGTSSNTGTLQVWDMTIASPTAHSASTNNRRTTRKTLGFSKKLSMHEVQICLSRGYYHFVRPHSSLKMRLDDGTRWISRTPAMAGNVTNHILSMKQLLTLPNWYD